jgi:hypothetical protein
MIGKKYSILYLFFIVTNHLAYSQNNKLNFDSILNRLKIINTVHIPEKVYLHFDKPYYAAGDTIYFKAYLTQGEQHEPSRISGVLHAELINSVGKIDQSILLQVVDGIAWGDFALPDSLPAGNYLFRAWTKWMRNEAAANFFERKITIGNTADKKAPKNNSSSPLSYASNADVQFMPEGGSLVNGLNSKIAFKAIGNTGLGMAIKGVVLNNDGKEVARFQSAHLGMGFFYLTPELGKTYSAKISFPDGTQKIFNLPLAAETGITLTLNNDSVQKSTVTITANQLYYDKNKNKDYLLLILSGSKATTVRLKLDSTVIKLDILKRKLQTGIATITLFSPETAPLCERLFFVQNYDGLTTAISSDKKSYQKRDKTTIYLQVKNRADTGVSGHFSVSVTDQSKVQVDENNEQTILSHLLLTSNLKGFVEQPNYYFNHITDTTLSNLDMVMLTQGYRRFEWKAILNENDQATGYLPEKALEISGQAKSLFGNALPGATVNLIGPNQSLLSTVTDNKGFFKFENLAFTDTMKFILQAVNAKGSNKTQIIYQKNKVLLPVNFGNLYMANTADNMGNYLKNKTLQLQDEIKYGSIKGKLLKEVVIKARKPDNDYKSSSIMGPGFADQVLHGDEIGEGGFIVDKLEGKLRGVHLTGSNVYLDGMKIDKDNLSSIPVSMIETVEVFKGYNAILYNTFGAVVVLTSGRVFKPSDIKSVGILPLTICGFYKARAFYAPKYDHVDEGMKRNDLRSTIYWQPELMTDKDGNASFDFFNADGTGTYRVVIEGIDNKGNLGRQVYTYKVQ